MVVRINIIMQVGDRIRIVKPTASHVIGDEGEIVEIDFIRMHAVVAQFPNDVHHTLFPIAGHCASLFVSVDVLYEVIESH